MYYLVWDVAFTKFFITPLTLSRHHKLTASKTLPSRFTMKSASLKSTLVICLSLCRIVRKKMQFGCLWVQNKISGSISKKIQLKFKQSGKMLPNHNSVLAEHISNLGPEKKAWSRYQVTNNGLRAQKKPENLKLLQFTTSSRRLDGGAYCGAPVGGKCMVSKAKLVLYAFAV